MMATGAESLVGNMRCKHVRPPIASPARNHPTSPAVMFATRALARHPAVHRRLFSKVIP